MLVIREEQIQTFIAENDAELEKVVIKALRDANPERVSGFEDAALGNMVRIGIERARSHGLSGAEDIAAFVAVMFEVAPNFDERQDIKAVLNDPNMAPAFRFYQLFESIPETSWEDAERFYDPNAWVAGTPNN